MKQKALLVTSSAKKKNNFWTCSITSPVGSIMPPCDLASIASVLRDAGIEVKILELRHYANPLHHLQSEVRNWNPDAIITNMSTASANEDYEIFRITKNTVQKRIGFSFHAMALPDEMFEMGATHVLVGDPEYSVVAAVRGETLERGIWTETCRNTPPGWVEDLDSLPFQALDLIDLDQYHSLIMGRDRFAILLGSRGCPYSCIYCVIPFLFGKKIRLCSVERIIKEIEWNKRNFQIKKFFFIDSAVNLDLDWLNRFCTGLLEKGVDIKWCCNMRVAPVSQALLDLMKKAGCFRIFYGVEDLDATDVLNRNTTLGQTRKAFTYARRAGIETVAFTLLLPGRDDTEKNMSNRIVSMATDIKADAIQCNIAIPYPGSRMFDEYDKEQTMPRDWSLYDPAGDGVPYPTDLDLMRVRRMVYLKFYLKNPTYVLKMIGRTGIRSIIKFIKNATLVLSGNLLQYGKNRLLNTKE